MANKDTPHVRGLKAAGHHTYLKDREAIDEDGELVARLTPANLVGGVHDYLHHHVGLSDEEMSHMLGVETCLGPAVVYAYRDSAGTVLAYRVHLVMWGPGAFYWIGAPASCLYGLEDLVLGPEAGVILALGEIQAHQLRDAGWAQVVATPAGGNLYPTALEALRGFCVFTIEPFDNGRNFDRVVEALREMGIETHRVPGLQLPRGRCTLPSLEQALPLPLLGRSLPVPDVGGSGPRSAVG